MFGFLEQRFQVQQHGSSLKQEFLAGLVSFVTGVYIVVVNGAILADAGIPLAAATVATALTTLVGCLLMGLWANAPLLLMPGMGLNALFTYTLVKSMGLSWQEALGVVTLSGLIFSGVAFTPLAGALARAIPGSLKEAITVGVGLFLAFIGLQKGGIVIAHSATFVAMGHLRSPQVLLTLITLLVTLVLHIRNVRGSFLISIGFGTVLAAVTGNLGSQGQETVAIASYLPVFGAFSLGKALSLTFWVATFSVTMVVLFENLGLVYGLLPDKAKFNRALQANALSVAAAGLLGTTPTVAAVEGAAGIASGGRTGLTSVTAGLLFLLSLGALPVIKLIPDSALAPVLIFVGGLMLQQVKGIPLDDPTEGIPAFLVIVLIPLTYSIADGMAFGFLAYPLLKLAAGRRREVARPLYAVSALFLVHFLFHTGGS